MKWNWQQPDWPLFSWLESRLLKAEKQFLMGSGVIRGVVSHLDNEDRNRLTVELMSNEALTTSEIEGEILDRDSVQSSIRRELGLTAASHRASPAEQGIAEMMAILYRNYAEPLNSSVLFSWHQMLMRGRQNIAIGCYRSHTEPMRVVSGKVYEPTVHFEAPPSRSVPKEMEAFLEWFNNTGPSGTEPLPALARAGTAHLYFESIHPFEDGNGRIGRAISEKALAQGLGAASLTALAATILRHRRSYYQMLEASNKRNEITEWLVWFAEIALEAQQRVQAQISFMVDKTRLLDKLRNTLNERQLKVLLRVMQEGPDGFRGGLSAGNYLTIAKTSPATARRDLADLVKKGALTRTGEKRHARYHLIIPIQPVSRVRIDKDGNIN